MKRSSPFWAGFECGPRLAKGSPRTERTRQQVRRRIPMNTTTKLTFGLFAVLSMNVLAGCTTSPSTDEMADNAAAIDTAQPIGEAQQAIMGFAPDQNTPYR